MSTPKVQTFDDVMTTTHLVQTNNQTLLFLLAMSLQNGNLKAAVHGANTPLLSSSILELVPANAEADDLEVRHSNQSNQSHVMWLLYSSYVPDAPNPPTCPHTSTCCVYAMYAWAYMLRVCFICISDRLAGIQDCLSVSQF